MLRLSDRVPMPHRDYLISDYERPGDTLMRPVMRIAGVLDRIDPPMMLQIERAGRTDPGEGLDVDAIYQLVESVRAITPAQPAQ